jgi:hypothetical protein
MTAPKKAWSLTELPSVLSISETVIREAVDNGDLVRRYASTRGVFYESDVDAWMRSLPTEKPGA